MDTELRKRLKKPPPVAPRYAYGVMNWICVFAAGLLVPAAVASPFAGLILVVFVLPVQVFSATPTCLYIGRHHLTGAMRRWMQVPLVLGAIASAGTFVAAAFSTGSRC